MIRKIPTVALLIGALAVAGQAQAHGGGCGNYWQGPAVFGAIVGSAIVGSALINANRPVYVQQPVYAASAGLCAATATGLLPASTGLCATTGLLRPGTGLLRPAAWLLRPAARLLRPSPRLWPLVTPSPGPALTAGLFCDRSSANVWINRAKVAVGTVSAAQVGKIDLTRPRLAQNGHIFVMTGPQAWIRPQTTG